MQSKRDIVGTAKLAKILGISDRRIQQLVTEGVFKKVGRGQYDLVEMVQTYIRYQVDLVKAKQATGTLLEEQTRLTARKADKEELDIARLKGELIPANEVLELWQKLVAAGRTRMLGLPSAMKTKHPNLPMDAVVTIEAIIRQILEDMSRDELPERYRTPVAGERKNLDASA